MLNVLFFGAPGALYLALILLPKGRPALTGAVGVAVGLVLLWLTLWQVDLDAEMETLGFLGLLGVSAAWFIASTLQVLRLRIPQTAPRWIWPLCAIATFAVVSFVILRLLGI